MSVRRPGKPSRRRPGRPLLGAEPLDQRLTVMVSALMLQKIESRSGGHIAEFVRRALGRVLAGRVGRGRPVGGRSVRKARIRRFGRVIKGTF